MRLDIYLLETNKTQAQFAKEIEESPQNIGRYVNGQRIPDEEKMLKIFSATNGKVTANDFYDLPVDSLHKVNGNLSKNLTPTTKLNSSQHQ